MNFYRLLLHLYPSSFRAEYGDEMSAIFALELGAKRRIGGQMRALAFRICRDRFSTPPWCIGKSPGETCSIPRGHCFAPLASP